MKTMLLFLAACLTAGALFIGGAVGAETESESDATARAALEEWVYQAALAHAKPKWQPQFPGYEETEAETQARYRLIARDIVAATGPKRKSAAALLLAFAIGESLLAKDADIGPCFRGKHDGKDYKKRCDGGLAATVWQMHQVYDMQAMETLTVEQLFGDRQRTARIFLKLATSSLSRCAKQGFAPVDQLSGVGLGECKAGDARVHARYHLWQKLRSFKAPAPG